MFQISLICLLLLVVKCFAQVAQCPGTFPSECSCTNSNAGPSIKCVTVTMETWDIQTTFDAISDAFDTTDAVMTSVSIDPGLVISPGEKFPINLYFTIFSKVPAHSVSTLKTDNLYLYADHKYTRIDPEAFSGTHSTVTSLLIYEMDFQDVVEAFDLFNNFKVMRVLQLDGNTLPHIPAHAFGDDLHDLASIFVRESGLHSIGDHAFAELPFLSNIFFDGNNLTLANISDTAFTFARTGVYMSLERNPGITHLPEEKFGNFLKGNQNTLHVGSDGGKCDPGYFLECDYRIDWICEAGVTRIFGYNCLEVGYVDIYDYCEQTFGNNPLYRENVEEVKKIQIADRVRYETLKAEEEFRRRSYAISKVMRQYQLHV